MIATLRRKLAMLLICVVSAVVLGTTWATLMVSEHQLELTEQARLNAQADRIAQDVRMNGIIQTSELAKTEVANNLIISIQDGGAPIPFRGGWQPVTDRDVLFARATASAPDADYDWNGVIEGDQGERYLAAIRRIHDYRNARTVVVLQDMRRADAQRLAQRLTYAGIALAALAIISLFCWFFTGRVIHPIQEAHEKQNQFVSAASHELRTPLQVIRINAEALKLNPPNPKPFIEQILSELSHMGRLSEDLLLLTATPNRTAMEGNPVEINELIRNAVEYHAAAAGQKGLQLSAEFPEVLLPLVEGNEAMLLRALNVLIDNAICYTPSGGHVNVSAKLRAREIAVMVEDDGPGVEPEHRERIFERFYRVDQSRTDRAHSGLGLSVARSIVESHGGKLTYAPVKPHGSRFCMILPNIRKEGND